MKMPSRFFALFILALADFTIAGEVSARSYGKGEVVSTSDSKVVTRAIVSASVPSAGISPLALSFVPAIELPPGDWSVAGLRVNLLVGSHRDVWGIDAGVLGNEIKEDMEGVQVAGLFNRIGHSDGAWQSAGVLNRCEGDFYGLQTAGFLNWTDGAVEGAQIALVNRASELSGLQIGLYNAIDRGSGVQIGFINAARSLDGLQIGVVNVIRDSTVPFLPIVNFAF